jgi:hypothetical protein
MSCVTYFGVGGMVGVLGCSWMICVIFFLSKDED